MRCNSREDALLIRQHRSMIETVNSQLEKMGLQRLHTRTNAGITLIDELEALDSASQYLDEMKEQNGNI